MTMFDATPYLKEIARGKHGGARPKAPAANVEKWGADPDTR